MPDDSKRVGPASPVRPLSSDFLDDLRAKVGGGGGLSYLDASALLDAHDTLLVAYHETEPLRAPVRDPAPPELTAVCRVCGADACAHCPICGSDKPHRHDSSFYIRERTVVEAFCFRDPHNQAAWPSWVKSCWEDISPSTRGTLFISANGSGKLCFHEPWRQRHYRDDGASPISIDAGDWIVQRANGDLMVYSAKEFARQFESIRAGGVRDRSPLEAVLRMLDAKAPDEHLIPSAVTWLRERIAEAACGVRDPSPPEPTAPKMADGPIHTYWHRRRDADPLHGKISGCLCEACQNERGYQPIQGVRGAGVVPPAGGRPTEPFGGTSAEQSVGKTADQAESAFLSGGVVPSAPSPEVIIALGANDISPDSWLNEKRFQWFQNGYAYATTQTRAIPALAKCAPEELHAAIIAILRGAGLPDADEFLGGGLSSAAAPPETSETEITALRVENGRLREALEDVALVCGTKAAERIRAFLAQVRVDSGGVAP